MLVALAFPVAYELYNVYKRKKISALSVIAIGGIFVTGIISLLGLSEGWLAVRRSVPYLAIAVALLISMRLKKSLLHLLLPQILDMDKIKSAAKERRNAKELNAHINKAGYILALLFIIEGVASYILTRTVITAETGTSLFNTEYARLRILALPFTTLPLLLGLAGAIMYLLSKIEKLTGIEPDQLLNKRD